MKETVLYSALIAGLIVMIFNIIMAYTIYTALKNGTYEISINANELFN